MSATRRARKRTERGVIPLVEVREHTAKVPEPVETTFDQMAFAVDPGIVDALGLRVLGAGCGGITASLLRACACACAFTLNTASA